MKSAHHGAAFREPCAQLIADSQARACDQLRAEVERLNDQLAKAVWDTDVNRANARADKAEAELAAERARLDWVEKHGPWDQWNGFRQTGITLHENIRASIDAAIKEGK
jgi:multidrug resistance efflux pump